MPAWQDGDSLGRPSPLGCAGTRRSTQPRRHARESADGHGQRASASPHRTRWPKGWSAAAFAKVTVDFRGRVRDLLVWSRPVLWYSVDKVNLVLLAVVRDPERVMHDDFFFSTDLTANPAAVPSNYAGRWSIECVNREVKQCLGAEGPQCWKHQGPERAASLSLWLYAAIWTWYIPTVGASATWIRRRMKDEDLAAFPLYPEEHSCRDPSAERILAIFSPL